VIIEKFIYVKSIRLVKSAYLLKNAPTGFSCGWATGTARAKAARETARMVLMNIIVFAIG